MPTGLLAKLGVAAVILFAPGGFILGAGLAAAEWRKRRARSDSLDHERDTLADADAHRA
jgi:hypothetical protein